MLEVKDLCVNYGAVHALNGISLTVNDGEICEQELINNSNVQLLPHINNPNINMSRHWRKAKEMIETQTLNGPGLLVFFVHTNDFNVCI